MAPTPVPAVPEDIVRLAHDVLAAACGRDLRLATAESCTGGLLASLLTDIPGVSHAFECGFVTYSDAAKTAMLGVPSATLADDGAVSKAAAIAMVEGALSRSGVDLAVAITGYADAAPDAAPGLVHLACARRGGAPRHREERFGAIGRDEVRLSAIRVALRLMRAGLRGLSHAA